MPWDSASFSGRLETEPVDESKVQIEAHAAHFPTPILVFFPFTQFLGAVFLRSKLCLALHPQWQNAPGPVPIDLDKLGACSPPWQMERAGWCVALDLRLSASANLFAL